MVLDLPIECTAKDGHRPALDAVAHVPAKDCGCPVHIAGSLDEPISEQDFPKQRPCERFKWLPTFATCAVCALTFGWPGIVWGFGIATTLAFHAPLLVNSAGHLWGARRFPTKDASRNNAVLGLLALGEGWHNNHHHDPSSARQGLVWWELDVTYYVIWLLSKLGVVWDVRQPRACSRTRTSLPSRA